VTTLRRQAEARFFHVALGRPTADSHRLLRRAGLRQVLGDLGSADAALPARLRVPRDLGRLDTEYLAAFEVGAPHPPVPLIECHWVRARAANQIIAENNRFYSAFGMSLRPGHELPDHLVCQLAFVEYLLWAVEEREARAADAAELRWALGDFIALHLQSWVPTAAGAAATRRLLPVFTALLQALRGWLQELAAEYPGGRTAPRPERAPAT
jgi:DMSO reductase family type II enzyme chaperone